MPSADLQRPAPSEDERIGERDLAHWHTAPGRLLAGWLTHVSEVIGRALRWSAANIALVVTVGVGLGVVTALTAGSAEVYENVVERDGISVIDQPVLDAAVRLRTPLTSRLVTDFTDVGGVVGMPVIAVVVALGLSLAWRRWMPLVLMGVAGLGSLVLTLTGKDLTARARPPRALAEPPFESSPSFPSGHTLNATVILGLTAYLLVIWLRRKRWRAVTVVVATVLVAAMGLSRVFLGHHWFTDVVAGWTIGLGWLATVITGHRVRITLDRRRRGGRSAG
jgi:undecaprenyl-diphosphatase